MSDPMYFNGIDGATGSYLLPPLDAEQLSAVIAGEPVDEAQKNELRSWFEHRTTAFFSVKEGVDPENIAEAGWGILFASDTDPAVIEALQPLIEHRRALAGSKKAHYFKQYDGAEAVRPGESKNAWLARHGIGPGPADPEKVPYYLLLVGDPEKIPYGFQTQLDVQYAVGRICFDTVEEYAHYAQSVVEAETSGLKLPRRAAFFGVANPDDPATKLSANQLIQPLLEARKSDSDFQDGGWSFDLVSKEGATRDALAELLGGPRTPALLFTASHGMSFPNGDPRQLPHQGSLLCQDWPGPRQWRKPIPEEFYFSADSLSSDARLLGTIAFLFACYGAGTPLLDDFAMKAFRSERAAIAPRPFISRLPQRMLSHPAGGALAVVGHVERAWGYSFVWERAGTQLAVFESTLKSLMDGAPIGHAFDYFNVRYAELSTVLSAELEDIQFGKDAKSMAFELAGLWTANNDARNYVILGDPAVRLMAAGKDEAAPAERPSIRIDSTPAPVMTKPATGGGEGTSFNAPAGQDEVPVAPSPSIQALAERLGAVLSASMQGSGTLKVSTYTRKEQSGSLPDANSFQGADLRAFTQVELDGSLSTSISESTAPDPALLNLHLEMVRLAQQSRVEWLRAAIEAASKL